MIVSDKIFAEYVRMHIRWHWIPVIYHSHYGTRNCCSLSDIENFYLEMIRS